MADDRDDAASTEALRERKDALARADDRSRLQSDLDRVYMDKMMERSEPGLNLAAIFDEGASVPLSGDLNRVIGGMADDVDAEISAFIEERFADVAFEGLKVNELLQAGGATLEQRQTIRRGLNFLKGKRYAEAVEWWRLNRPKDTFAPFYTTATVLLALSYQLAGDEERAKATIRELSQRGRLAK